MRVGIMQPYFFPYIAYFQLIKAVDLFVVYDDVNYFKQGWIARNKILLNGNEHMLILHLTGASSSKLINEVRIGSNSGKLIKTIWHAYSKAPFFYECFPVIEKILKNDEKHLSKFLFFLIKEVCHFLQIKTELVSSSALYKKNSLKGQDKGLHICECLQAKTYINSIGGRHLYSKDAFAEKGLQLMFLKTLPVIYKQFSQKHVPGLSIIDVMMFNSRDTINDYLDWYELI